MHCKDYIILNLRLQQLVSDSLFTWKPYILQQGFKVSGICDTSLQSNKRGKNHDFFINFFGVKKINELVVTGEKLTNNIPRACLQVVSGRMWLAGRQLYALRYGW
jgi:hypothetical protein